VRDNKMAVCQIRDLTDGLFLILRNRFSRKHKCGIMNEIQKNEDSLEGCYGERNRGGIGAPLESQRTDHSQKSGDFLEVKYSVYSDFGWIGYVFDLF